MSAVISRRLKLFQQIKAAQTPAQLTGSISVKFDGSSRDYKAGTVSAGDVFADKAKEFHFASLRIGESKQATLRDLYNRPLTESCEIEGVKFD